MDFVLSHTFIANLEALFLLLANVCLHHFDVCIANVPQNSPGRPSQAAPSCRDPVSSLQAANAFETSLFLLGFVDQSNQSTPLGESAQVLYGCFQNGFTFCSIFVLKRSVFQLQIMLQLFLFF